MRIYPGETDGHMFLKAAACAGKGIASAPDRRSPYPVLYSARHDALKVIAGGI